MTPSKPGRADEPTDAQKVADAVWELCKAVRRLDHMGDCREYLDRAADLASEVLWPESADATPEDERAP